MGTCGVCHFHRSQLWHGIQSRSHRLAKHAVQESLLSCGHDGDNVVVGICTGRHDKCARHVACWAVCADGIDCCINDNVQRTPCDEENLTLVACAFSGVCKITGWQAILFQKGR